MTVLHIFNGISVVDCVSISSPLSSKLQYHGQFLVIKKLIIAKVLQNNVNNLMHIVYDLIGFVN